MTGEEAKKVIDELKAQGTDEQELLAMFYTIFVDDKITVEDLEVLCNAIGYELTDEFKAMSPEDQKTKGYEEVEDETEESDETVEDAKNAEGKFESEDEESGENTEKKDEESDKESDSEKSDDEKSDNEESDDDKAKRLFGFDR